MSSVPNVLLIVSDQHLHSVAGYMGDPIIHTPNLDNIAGEGTVFEKTYCQSPVCTPSRASFLTGKYCHNLHCWQNHGPIFPEHKTIAHYFADAGYETCLIGKMHFGGKDQFHGFRHRPYGDLWHGLSHQPDPIEAFPNMQSAKMWSGPAGIPESLLQEVVSSIETTSFIKNFAADHGDKPWFVCMSYCRPHPPFAVPSRFHKKYAGRVPFVGLEDDDEAGREEYPSLVRSIPRFNDMTAEQHVRGREAYYACVDFVDDCIGTVLHALERDRLLDNTIIAYISDHGDQTGHHGIWDKGHHYEEAVRAPFVMSGPGIPKGLRIEKITGLIDLMPTLMELCGISVPGDLDGVSLVPFFAGNRHFVPHEFLIAEHMAVSSVGRAGHIEVSGRNYPSFRSVITERFKYTETYETVEQSPILFDRETDAREFKNVHGHPEYREVEKTLKSILDGQRTIQEWAVIVQEDAERAKQYRDGIKPSMPNQYRLSDGRIFDAEKSLYDVRWLKTTTENTAGFIPQRFH